MSLLFYFFRTGFSLEKARYRQLREDLRQDILPEKIKEDGFQGQYGQDLFASNYFNGKKEGTFVDIGANDGKTFSNSYALEKNYNWKGLCVEPLPEEFEQLKKIRKCALENKCIGEQKSKAKFLVHGMLSGIVDTYDKKHLHRIIREEKESGKKERKFITVDVVPLLFLLEKYNIEKIDFLSIDVEGAEKSVLDGIDLQNIDVQLIAIENNYKDIDLYKKIIQQGYKLSAVLGCDEIFEKV